eukprot:scaffold39385_cov62-Cyclotella_meneghiniana.AAC.2
MHLVLIRQKLLLLAERSPHPLPCVSWLRTGSLVTYFSSILQPGNTNPDSPRYVFCRAFCRCQRSCSSTLMGAQLPRL